MPRNREYSIQFIIFASPGLRAALTVSETFRKYLVRSGFAEAIKSLGSIRGHGDREDQRVHPWRDRLRVAASPEA